MPQVGRVEITIIEEDQSRWLAFQQKELDYLDVPATFSAAGARRRQQAEAGAGASRASRSIARIDPDITYTSSTSAIRSSAASRKEKIALRRAIIMGYNIDEEITRRAQGPGGRRRRCRFPPASSATIRTTAASTSTTRRSPTSCSTTSATRKAPTATARCPTASRWCSSYATRRTAHRARVQRAVEEVDGRHRHPHGVRDRASSPTTSRRRRPAS